MHSPSASPGVAITQNNINTFGKLLEFIYQDKYDQEDLDYKLNKNILSYEETFNYSQIDFEKALEFADLIFDDNIDKINFLKQYIKDDNVQKEGKLQKTLSFTKKNLHY